MATFRAAAAAAAAAAAEKPFVASSLFLSPPPPSCGDLSVDRRPRGEGGGAHKKETMSPLPRSCPAASLRHASSAPPNANGGEGIGDGTPLIAVREGGVRHDGLRMMLCGKKNAEKSKGGKEGQKQQQPQDVLFNSQGRGIR